MSVYKIPINNPLKIQLLSKAKIKIVYYTLMVVKSEK